MLTPVERKHIVAFMKEIKTLPTEDWQKILRAHSDPKPKTQLNIWKVKILSALCSSVR